MKHILLKLVPIFFLSNIYGQTKINSREVIKPLDIFFDKPLNLSSIKVTDSRFDTTKIGYLKSGNQYKKIVTEGPLAKVIQNHLNGSLSNHLNPLAGQSLLIVIKKLWLEQITIDELENKKIATTINAGDANLGMCTSLFEIYLQKDTIYIPLLKVDTSLFTLKKLNRDGDYLIAYTLENCLNKLSTLDFNKVFNNRKKLFWQDIEDYNNKRFLYPRFKDEFIKRGIYLTFKDFINNKPITKNFVTQSNKLTDELYVVEETGETVLLEDFWGFCDGQKNYIHIGLSFFELTRESNTYELWGSKTIIQRVKRYSGGGGSGSGSLGRDAANLGMMNGLFNSKKTNINYKPLQLDMETGKVY